MHGTNGSGLLDWNDARIFLAVARHGSLRAAGRALGISQPTIGRRIAAFEAVFGGPTLFDRLPEGLRLNEAGAALLPVAERCSRIAMEYFYTIKEKADSELRPIGPTDRVRIPGEVARESAMMSPSIPI